VRPYVSSEYFDRNSISDSTVIRRDPYQPICVLPLEVEAAGLKSEKRGKILDFYFLLRHCLADTLQVVKVLN
jgi:hypothetical protein